MLFIKISLPFLEEDELEEEEAELDDDEEEEITGAVGIDQAREKPRHNNLINELRSEIGREIQRLEMIYMPGINITCFLSILVFYKLY